MKSENIKSIQKLYENVAPSSLTEREKLLVSLLFTEKESSFFDKLPNGSYRILQFKCSNFAELRETFRFLFPDFVDSDETQQLIVERFSGDNLTRTELLEIVETLSQDLGDTISLYVGRFTDKEALNSIFQIEAQIFSEDKSYSEYVLSESLSTFDGEILQEIRKELLKSPEDKELVRALYHTNGNQSQAAKILFVHRNTLLGKIKKYEQKYGLQLLGSDLVLAYNLL